MTNQISYAQRIPFESLRTSSESSKQSKIDYEKRLQSRPEANSFAEARTVHDEKHKNYYDRLQQEMQRKRTATINSQPTVTKYTQRGDINHEPARKTCNPMNYHTQSLNHSIIPLGRSP